MTPTKEELQQLRDSGTAVCAAWDVYWAGGRTEEDAVLFIQAMNHQRTINALADRLLAAQQEDVKPIAKIVFDQRLDVDGKVIHKSNPQIFRVASSADLMKFDDETPLYTTPPSPASEPKGDAESLWEQYRQRADVSLWIRGASKESKRIFMDGYALAAHQPPTQPVNQQDALDAKRYRWLRGGGTKWAAFCNVEGGIKFSVSPEEESHEALDAAIDAEIAAAEKGGE